MQGRVSETIERVAGLAIGRGLGFLETAVETDGAWPTGRYESLDLGGPRHDDRDPFVPALGLLALNACGSSRAEALRSRTRTFLLRRIEYPGVWRYADSLPPDLDTTALCSLAAGGHPWVLLGRNIGRVLSNRDREGRFLTWMVAPDGAPDPIWTDVDPVVNAHVLAYLGDRAETRVAQRWVETLIEDNREADSSRHYPRPMALYLAAARASCRAKPVFARLRPILTSRIMDRGGACGRDFVDPLETAWALSALGMLGTLERADMRPSLERLIEAQRPDGSWPECLAWCAPPPLWGFSFASEVLTTVCCIEAMERFVRPRQDRDG